MSKLGMKNNKGPAQGHTLERVRTKISEFPAWLRVQCLFQDSLPGNHYNAAQSQISEMYPRNWHPSLQVGNGSKPFICVTHLRTIKQSQPEDSFPVCLHSKTSYCKNRTNKTLSTSPIWLVVLITTNDSLTFYRELEAPWKNVCTQSATVSFLWK